MCVQTCWYQNSCNKFNSTQCNNSCIRYIEMDYLISNSNIPKNNFETIKLVPANIDLEAFAYLANIKNNIVNFINSGTNLYIYSYNFGNGKTTWAIKLMLAYFNKIWAGNGLKRKGIFIHVPTFLTKCKAAIKTTDAEFESLRNDLDTVDIVIWDDIASNKLSDYDYTLLLSYIDGRVLNHKTNIYTGNLDEEHLTDALGNRLKSRVWNNSLTVEFKGLDRRGEYIGSSSNIK